MTCVQGDGNKKARRVKKTFAITSVAEEDGNLNMDSAEEEEEEVLFRLFMCGTESTSADIKCFI